MFHKLIEKCFSNCGCSRSYLSSKRDAAMSLTPGTQYALVPFHGWMEYDSLPGIQASFSDLLGPKEYSRSDAHMTYGLHQKNHCSFCPHLGYCILSGHPFSRCSLWEHSHDAVRSPRHTERLQVGVPVHSLS